MDQRTDHAIKNIISEMSSWNSVEVKVHTSITNRILEKSGRSLSFNATRERYIETLKGSRFSETWNLKDDNQVGHESHYFNGEKSADVAFHTDDLNQQKSITIQRHFWMEDKSDRKQLPHPILFYYVGREPLYEALLHAKPIGNKTINGRECDGFLFEQVAWAIPQDQVFYLEAETSVPVQVESFRDASSRLKNKMMGVWTAEIVDQINGHRLPLESKLVAFDDDQHEILSWKYVVEAVNFNKDYPRADFWPTFQPGVVIVDTIADRTHQVPVDKAKGDLTSVDPGSTSATTTTSTFVAERPYDWSNSLPIVVLSLSAILLLSAGFMIRRRRSRSE